MVSANFANFANFWGIDRGKLAELAKLAPMDKVSWGSATGWPAVSITWNWTMTLAGPLQLKLPRAALPSHDRRETDPTGTSIWRME